MTPRNWDHSGKTRQQRGYGREHELMREHLMTTVVLCEECTRQGRTTAGLVADHIKPLAKGGTGARSNYQLLCRDCARTKDAADRGKPLRKQRPRIGEDGWFIEEPNT